MRRALALAEKGRGYTSPNPMVGAVLVKKGAIVGEGYHRAAGKDHAEIAALKEAGNNARGADLYVTLEPCCHTGRTGPCTAAVIKAGIRRVVVAIKDSNPLVNGNGVRQLRKAGVVVETGVLRAEAKRLNDQYFGYIENGRPFIVLKWAQTLDGRIAAVTGDSQWVSGEQSLKFAHGLRRDLDGVLVVMGTVRKDNPSLTVRRVKGRNPYRVVVSDSLRFPKTCELLDNNSDFRTVIAGSAKSIDRFSRTQRGRNVIYWAVKTNRGGLVDVKDLVARADEFGLCSLLVEGGSALLTSFIAAGLFDKVVVICAPKILGRGLDAVGDLKSRRLADSVVLDDVTASLCGRDTIITGYRRGEA